MSSTSRKVTKMKVETKDEVEFGFGPEEQELIKELEDWAERASKSKLKLALLGVYDKGETDNFQVMMHVNADGPSAVFMLTEVSKAARRTATIIDMEISSDDDAPEGYTSVPPVGFEDMPVKEKMTRILEDSMAMGPDGLISIKDAPFAVKMLVMKSICESDEDLFELCRTIDISTEEAEYLVKEYEHLPCLVVNPDCVGCRAKKILRDRAEAILNPN